MDQSSTDDWTLGYAFYIEEVDEKSKCSTKIIVEHDGSPFNKVPLIVKLTEGGHASLTKDSLTIVKNGKNERKSYRCAI